MIFRFKNAYLYYTIFFLKKHEFLIGRIALSLKIHLFYDDFNHESGREK